MALFSTFPIVNQTFFKSSLSIGIVNLKPLVPFHVLVIPKRVVPRLSNLSPAEVTDLFLSVQTISKSIEIETKAMSMTISIQDGPYAGQTVPHIHVHVLPRFAGDFQNLDDVYDQLDNLNLGEAYTRSEKKKRVVVDDEKRVARTAEVMEVEARYLSLLFEKENRGFE